MGLFDGKRKLKEAELARLGQDLVHANDHAKSLSQQIQQERAQRAQSISRVEVRYKSEIVHIKARLKDVQDEKRTMQFDLDALCQGHRSIANEAEELVKIVSSRDEQIGNLQKALASLTSNEIHGSNQLIQDGHLMEVVNAQAAEIQKLEGQAEEKQRVLRQSRQSLDQLTAELDAKKQEINGHARRLQTQTSELENLTMLMVYQEGQAADEKSKLEKELMNQRESGQEALDRALLDHKQKLARTKEENEELQSMLERRMEDKNEVIDELDCRMRAMMENLKQIDIRMKDKHAHTIEHMTRERRQCEEVHASGFRDLLQRQEEEVAKLRDSHENRVQAISHSHEQELIELTRWHEDTHQKVSEEIRCLEKEHESHIMQLQAQNEAHIAKLSGQHRDSLNQLRADLNQHHDAQIVDLSSKEEEFRRAVDEKSCTIAEVGQQLEEASAQVDAKTKELEELAETHGQTRLTLNRTRVELSNETRKARQMSQETERLSRQFEFVQQRCVVLQEKVTDAEREKDRRNADHRRSMSSIRTTPPRMVSRISHYPHEKDSELTTFM
jgi:chromosome segregation ATPase